MFTNDSRGSLSVDDAGASFILIWIFKASKVQSLIFKLRSYLLFIFFFDLRLEDVIYRNLVCGFCERFVKYVLIAKNKNKNFSLKISRTLKTVSREKSITFPLLPRTNSQQFRLKTTKHEEMQNKSSIKKVSALQQLHNAHWKLHWTALMFVILSSNGILHFLKLIYGLKFSGNL